MIGHNLSESIEENPDDTWIGALRLSSLDHRSRRGDMLQTYKIIDGIDRVDHLFFFMVKADPSTVRW